MKTKNVAKIGHFFLGIAIVFAIANIVLRWINGDRAHALTWVLVALLLHVVMLKDFIIIKQREVIDKEIPKLRDSMKTIHKLHTDIKEHYGTKENTPGRANPDGQ